MKIKQRRVVLLALLFCLFLLNVIPIVQANTDYFTNSVVIIIGKCNTVTTPALWLFGPKLIYNRRVIMQANGEEGEKINALILPPKIGFYFGYKNILIQMEGAKGFFFSGEKSLLLQQSSQRIFAMCKATDVYVSYEIN
jgi:hypothetical protein